MNNHPFVRQFFDLNTMEICIIRQIILVIIDVDIIAITVALISFTT